MVHLEDEDSVSRSSRRRPCSPYEPEDVETVLRADAHELESLGPAPDDAVQAKVAGALRAKELSNTLPEISLPS